MESEFTLFWSDIDKASAHWILETVYTIKTIALIIIAHVTLVNCDINP